MQEFSVFDSAVSMLLISRMAWRSVHVRIEGRVQGVGYRAWCASRARSLGLSGWVRNRRESWVEAVFSGKKQRVEAMLQACHKGPPAAQVQNIQISEHADKPVEAFFVLETV